ncbi:MAG TPA: VWA domain-containing protein [Blastocatellia bacterium]|nr:VWA domain-containing protein [Blastocatellia bacterium]
MNTSHEKTENKNRTIGTSRILVHACLIAAFCVPPSLCVNAQSSNRQTTNQRQKQPQKPPQKPPEKKEDDQKDAVIQGQDNIVLGTELITIPFSVTDSLNRYVNDLNQGDIEVFEDDKPQKVFSFSREADINLKYALAIDTSNSQRNTLSLEKTAALRFFRVSMHPKDSAAILTFQHNTDLLQPMTSDLDAITKAVGRVGDEPPSAQGGTALYDAFYIAADDFFVRGGGRQVLILLTDGYDFESSIDIKDAIERAVRAETVVYAIGIGDSFNFSGINTRDLNLLAKSTGGRAFFPHRDSDLDDAFRQIQSDLRQRYVLTYSSSNTSHDGSFRTIKVQVKDRPELVVRYRRGYYAPAQSK